MRLLSRFSVLVAVAAGLAGCANPTTEALPENLVSRNDFESLEGWAPATPSLTTTRAHSGRHAIKVDAGVEYSVSYINTLLKVSPSKLQKLDVSGWVFRDGKEANAKLVVEIKNPATGQSVFWGDIDFGQEAKQVNTWEEVKKTFPLPTTIEPTHELRVYMWRANAQQPVYLDDVTITRG